MGVDDEVGTQGSVVFQVYADATKVYDSGAMTGATATQGVDVSVAGANELLGSSSTTAGMAMAGTTPTGATPTSIAEALRRRRRRCRI